MKYWIRDNRVEALFILGIVFFLVATVVASIWTTTSGHPHTGWEVLFYMLIGLIAIAAICAIAYLLYLVISTINRCMVWAKEQGKHSSYYMWTHHPLSKLGKSAAKKANWTR